MNFRKACIGIFVNNENEFLIGKSLRDGGFKFPQGGRDEGETPKENLFREIKEELGICLCENDILEEFEETIQYLLSNKGKKSLLKREESKYDGQEMNVFKIKFDKNMKFILDEDEFVEMFWVKVEDFDNFDFKHRKEAYKKALEMCGFNF